MSSGIDRNILEFVYRKEHYWVKIYYHKNALDSYVIEIVVGHVIRTLLEDPKIKNSLKENLLLRY
jgi:hypothetical protein